MSKWIEYYCCNAVGVEPFKKESYEWFGKKIANPLILDKLKEDFRNAFEELHDLFDMLSTQYESL